MPTFYLFLSDAQILLFFKYGFAMYVYVPG